jgi:hypothetical protein
VVSNLARGLPRKRRDDRTPVAETTDHFAIVEPVMPVGRIRAGRSVPRIAVAVSVALVATFTGTVGLFSASAQVIAPAAASSASSGLPVCPPGQEAKTVAGSGTPAPLGNLENVPAGIAGGGTFAGVALDAEQVKMAATVAAVGKQMGITRRGIEIGIAVATEQSSLRPDAVNDKWLGLFQQNPVDYTMYPRTEPGGAAWMFYDRLLKLVPGYDTDPRTDYEIGDVVQLTGTGERFGQYQDMARDLAGQLVDNVSLAQDDVTCVPAPPAEVRLYPAAVSTAIMSCRVRSRPAAAAAMAVRVGGGAGRGEPGRQARCRQRGRGAEPVGPG